MDTLRRIALAVALLGLPACLDAPNEGTSGTSTAGGSTGAACQHTDAELCAQSCSHGQCDPQRDSHGCPSTPVCDTSTSSTATGSTGASCAQTRDQLCASCGDTCTLGSDANHCPTFVSCGATTGSHQGSGTNGTDSTGTTGHGASTGTSGSACYTCDDCDYCCDLQSIDANGCAHARTCDGPYLCSFSNTSTTGTTGQGGTTGASCVPAGAQGSTGGASTHCSLTNAYENCSQREVDCTGTACTCTEGNATQTVSTAADADCQAAYDQCYGGSMPGTTGTTGQQGSSTPLVLSFGGEAISFVQAPGRFELSGRGDRTDWVSARTPWLALDLNGNGRIDDGSELFGSLTVLPDGRRARNGFEALAALDANHDGVIDARDPGFAKLVLWRDDGDRVSQLGELQTLAQAGVISLALDYATRSACDARGNCEVERARFTFQGPHGTTTPGSLVDVHLAHQQVQVADRLP